MRRFIPLLLGFSSVLYGAECRIDFGAEGGLAFRDISENLVGLQAGWRGAQKDRRLIVQGAVEKEFREFSVTLVPKAGGEVTFFLMGGAEWIRFRAVRVTGATLVNGDFVQRDANGDLSAWAPQGEGPRLENGHAVANHDNRWSQTVTCREGEPIVVTFEAAEL